MKRFSKWIRAVMVVALFAACGPEGGGGPDASADAQLSTPVADAGVVQTDAKVQGPMPVQIHVVVQREVTGVPCEAAQLLFTYCTVCHGKPPYFDTPMTLLSAEDLAASPPESPNATYAQLAVERMRDTVNPMPPGGAGPTAEEIDAFAAWVDAGQPGGSCATASDPLPTQNDLRD